MFGGQAPPNPAKEPEVLGFPITLKAHCMRIFPYNGLFFIVKGEQVESFPCRGLGAAPQRSPCYSRRRLSRDPAETAAQSSREPGKTTSPAQSPSPACPCPRRHLRAARKDAQNGCIVGPSAARADTARKFRWLFPVGSTFAARAAISARVTVAADVAASINVSICLSRVSPMSRRRARSARRGFFESPPKRGCVQRFPHAELKARFFPAAQRVKRALERAKTRRIFALIIPKNIRRSVLHQKPDIFHVEHARCRAMPAKNARVQRQKRPIAARPHLEPAPPRNESRPC